MNGHTLSRALERSRNRAEKRHLNAMQAKYERLVRRAGREAESSLRAQSVTAASDWQPPPEGLLFQIQTMAPAAAAALASVHRRIVAAVAGPPLDRFGIAWDVAHPLSAELLENAGRRTGERLGEAVQPVLRQTLAQAYAEGLAVKDAGVRIREAIDEAAPWQAEMLARTDLNGLANGASTMAAKLAGVGSKTWLTAGDEKVRPEHMAANGQTVPIDEPFQVCGEQLAWPGDPAGSDACTANCRCTVVYGEEAATAAATEGEIMGRTAAVTITVDEEQATPAAGPVAWVSDIAFEGAATEDGRFILPGALEWREPPLTLMALTETGPGGHEGAFVAGRMDSFEKVDDFDMDGDPLPEGVVAIRSVGVFDVGGENGAEVARLVDELTVRGVSVDLAVQEWVFRDPETGELFEPDELTPEQMERAFFGELQQAVRKGSIMAATVCPTPAFADARIVVTASGRRSPRLTLWAPITTGAPVAPLTAAAAGLAPVKPPRDWFETPEPNEPTPLTFTREGHVYGHVALWGSCHTGRPGQCFTPPQSPSGYKHFHLGEVECDGGERVACGQITFHGNHAPLSLNPDRTRDHYANSALAGADVRATDGKHGIWVCGAVRPNLTADQARALAAAKPSGDWRSVRLGGPLELMGILAVNIPGYPVPRSEARLVASAGNPDGELVALIGGADFEDEDEQVERDLRILAARAQGIDALAELAGV